MGVKMDIYIQERPESVRSSVGKKGKYHCLLCAHIVVNIGIHFASYLKPLAKKSQPLREHATRNISHWQKPFLHQQIENYRSLKSIPCWW